MQVGMRGAISKSFYFSLPVALWIATCFLSCKNDEPAAPSTRTFRMGFQNSTPDFTNADLFLQALALWVPTSDAAIITTEVPWESLLAGEDPRQYVADNYSALVAYYRQHNLKLWVYIDPENGLNRSTDASALVAANRSMAEPDIQKLYRRFTVVMDSMLLPEHLGLALETNLIRISAPDAIYAGIVQATHDAAIDVAANNPTKKLSISIQAEIAWGRLIGNGTFQGIAQDLKDFSFMEELGISSYPYFAFNSPHDIPDDYYSRLTEDRQIPLFVIEGGWTSSTFTTTTNSSITSTPEIQQSYIARQADLLGKASATGWFQLTFTDIDISTIPQNVDPSLANFAYLGLVDKTLSPKPAFDTWKEIFKRPLK